jgi:hypothetical protein
MKIIIASRPFNHQSNGIVVLQKLYKELNELGFDCRIIFFEGDGFSCKWYFSNALDLYISEGQKFVLEKEDESSVNKFLSDTKKNGLIIYPEIIYGNPLNGKNIIRYLLNKEGALKKWGMNAGATDYMLVFSKIYRHNFNGKLFYPNDLDWLDKEIIPSDKNIEITYIGKGIKYGINSKISETIEITRSWPIDKSTYHNLLKKCKYFYSFDTLSATNADAMLAGAIPFVFELGPLKLKEISNAEIPFYSGRAIYDKNMKITSLDYDYDQFIITRGEAISKIYEYKKNYSKNVRIIIEDACKHFGMKL